MKQKKHISLSVTERCNLNCIYCFETSKSSKRISYETALAVIDKELNCRDEYDLVNIDFMGGEPFLEFALIRRICEHYWGIQTVRPLIFSTTTNGTLVHGEIREWLECNHERFFCALSLDGNQSTQNTNRSNSFDRIDVAFFRTMWPNQVVKAITSYQTLPSLYENVVYLHSLGFPEVQIKLAYGFDWSDPDACRLLTTELEKLVAFYVEHPHLKPCTLLDLHAEKLILPNEQNVRWCNAGTRTISYDMDGNPFPCRYFQDLRRDGKLTLEEMWSVDFKKIQDTLSEPCSHCLIHNICRTCYAQNYDIYGDFGKKPMFLCRATRITAFMAATLIKKKLESGIMPDNCNISPHDLIELCQKIESAYKHNTWITKDTGKHA